MNDLHVPTQEQVCAALRPLTVAQLQALAGLSGVSFHTLLKIRDGATDNPRVGTVSQFWPHLPSVAPQQPALAAAS
jgi:hypothetical protein